MPGPSMFLAPGFLKAGDANADGRLSSGEFLGLGEKWFVEWDKARGGKLTTDQVRAGLNAVLAFPGFGGPPPGGGGAPRGPGAPGAPGGPVPGLNLQGPEGKRNGIASVLGIEFEYVRADLEFEGRRLDNVAVRFKGNGTFLESRGSLKRSLKIDLNRFVKGRKLAGVSKLNLQNNVTDATCMNEVLSYRLYRDAGVPSPRTAYARVWVTVPGKQDRTYLGLYSLSENVDNNFARDRFGTRKGAIFKPVTPELFADLGDDWAKYQQTYDPKTEVSPEETGRVIELCRLVSHADDAEFAARVFDYFDLDQVARYLAVLVWQCDLDSILGPGQNFYLYLHPQTRKFQFLPWDQDHSWGQFPMTGTPEQRENLSLLKPWQGERRFLDRLFKVDAFKQRYLARMEEFSRTTFLPERFHQQLDEIAAVIRPAIQEESAAKVERFDLAVAGKVGQGGRGGFGFGQPTQPLRPFVTIRARSVRDQLDGTSPGQTLGGFGFGFGGPGGPGGPGGGPGGPAGRSGGPGGPSGFGPGGPGGFGPGTFLGPGFMNGLKGGPGDEITREEFTRGFARWFEAWNTDRTGVLTDEQLRAGIDQDLSPFRGGPPGGPAFGPPPQP